MRRILVEDLISGMVLGRAIYHANGQILLAKDMVLKEAYIQRLLDLKIPTVYIDDQLTKDIIIEDVISEKTRIKAISQVRQSMERLKLGRNLDDSIVCNTKNAVSQIVDDLLENPEVIINLSDIRTVDDYTFGHCVNVAVLSIAMGKALRYNQNELKNLGIGAVLHDVGKIKIEDEILNKPGSLTEEEYDKIKNHTWFGYNVLRDYEEISIISAHVALQHHERFNGDGYPRGLKGNKIHEFAQIVSIADVYDALTANRVYKKAAPPHKAINFISTVSGYQFNPKFVDEFLKHLPLYPLGTMLRLSTGEKAIVIKINGENINRPVVRLVQDHNEDDISQYDEIDLIRKPDLFITEVLS